MPARTDTPLGSHTTDESRSTLAAVLDAACRGDGRALRRLWEAVTEELEHIGEAERTRDEEMARLVRSAVLRLFGRQLVSLGDRSRVHVEAARIVEHLLGRRARRCGRDAAAHIAARSRDQQRLRRLGNALAALERIRPRAATAARLRLFAGLPTAKQAAILGVPAGEVEAEWTFARAWIRRMERAADAQCR